MRAALLEEQGKPLRICDDVEIEEPRAGEVLVRVTNCGVCHSDLNIAEGAFPAPLPIVLGHEAAGVVEVVGAGVEALAPGDPVVLTPCPPCGACYWCVRGEASHCVQSRGIQTSALPDGRTGLSRAGETVYRGVNLGAFAEYVLAPASAAVRIPRDVPLDTACVIGCAVQTGVGAALNTARVEPGSTVLVLGLGGIGLSVVQGARIAGAARILVSDPVAGRRAAAEALGATDLLDPAGDVTAQAHALTEVGVDYAFECVGRGALVATAVAATRLGGTTVAVGAPPISESVALEPAAAFVISGKRLLGCVLGSVNSRRDIPRFVSLWRSGRLELDALVTARRPLAEIGAAMDDLAAGRGIRSVLSI